MLAFAKGEVGVERIKVLPWFRRPAVRSLMYAGAGGVILLAVDAALNVKNLQGPGLLPYLASAFVGCVVGWIFDLGSRMNEITHESIEKMTELSQILEFQQQPLRLLVQREGTCADGWHPPERVDRRTVQDHRFSGPEQVPLILEAGVEQQRALQRSYEEQGCVV